MTIFALMIFERQVSNAYNVGTSLHWVNQVNTFSSREFNQDVGKAKRAAEDGPVFITDRGALAHVLLTVEQYYRLVQSADSVADLLAMPDAAEVEFESVRDKDTTLRQVDLA